MKKSMSGAALLAIIAAIGLSAQSTGGGMRYVMKMELVQIGDAQQASNQMAAMAINMFKQTVLPDGSVEMEMLTDGQSLRTEMRGQMATLPKGAIVLYPAGQTDGFVLNPQEKTYYVMKPPQAPVLPGGMAMPKAEIAVKPSGTFETIAGHKAEKVVIAWRMPMPVPEGVELPPGMPTELTMDIENWCASDMKIPSGATRMMSGMAQAMPGFGLEEIAKACPFAMRSTMRMSMLPGYAIVSTVTSTSDASPAPDTFKVPADYKEVPAPVK